MKKEKQEEKKFITKVREMSKAEKIMLSLEGCFYLLATSSLFLMGKFYSQKEYQYLLLVGLYTIHLGLSGMILNNTRRATKSYDEINNLLKEVEENPMNHDESKEDSESKTLNKVRKPKNFNIKG